MPVGDDWDTHPNGDIAANPLMGWSFAILPLACILRAEYAEQIGDIDARRPSAIQLAMSGPQARELGQALLRIADKIEAQPLGTRQ